MAFSPWMLWWMLGLVQRAGTARPRSVDAISALSSLSSAMSRFMPARSTCGWAGFFAMDMPRPVSAMVQRQTALPFSSNQSSKVVVILPLGRLYLMQLL